MHRQSSLVACTCVVCGGQFEKLACRVRQGKGRFCSLTCARSGQRRRGGPVADPNRPLAVRFSEKVDRSDQNGCWTWIGAKNAMGYGLVNNGEGSKLAHRIAWELENGPIAAGLQVRHVVCANPPCVRIDHLALGTRDDNMADMAHDGSKKGERHHKALLTDAQVYEIRQRRATGGVRYTDLAAEYGVKPHTIGSIVRRESWSHVT